jgi:enamine deaminase RidA (YjgF/YER057c/UK114 family)
MTTGPDAPTNGARLAALGLVLPPVPTPAAAYVPARRHGDLVLTAGQLPMVDGALVATGAVGAALDVDRAAELAGVCALNVLAAAAAVAGGLDAITGVVRATVYVASAPGFTSQHLVANGASQRFADVLGAGAGHARIAVGVASLPLDAPVEVEAILSVRA